LAAGRDGNVGSVGAVSMTPDLKALLVDARDYILFDRDCFYEGITTQDGRIYDEQDRLDLAAVDELIDRLDAEIERCNAPDPFGEALNAGNGTYRP
jgi:hypothetical protein